MSPHRTAEREESLRDGLRARRLGLGLRQRDLADRLGVGQSFVSKYESGERRLAFVEVAAICQALELDFLHFVREWMGAGPDEGLNAIPR